MKVQSMSLVGLGLLVGLGSAIPVAIAQSTNIQPLEDFRPDQRSGDLNSRNGSEFSGVHDLIHRAMQGTRDPLEVREEQQENLNSAAEQFRAEQLKRLRQQPQAAPDSVTSAPSSAPNQ